MAKSTLYSYKQLTQGKLSQQKFLTKPLMILTCAKLPCGANAACCIIPAKVPKLTILPKPTTLVSTLDGKLAII